MITDIRNDFWVIMIEIKIWDDMNKKRYKRIFIDTNKN